ncbi:hypothetical protein S245_037602, partial [Arachis hypogaea]
MYHSADSKPPAMDSPVTLLIKHLLEAIPHDTLSRLLSHYGASSLRPCSTGRLRNCAFVDFKNEMSASQAQRQLHGLRLLGKVLSAERANNPMESGEKGSVAQLGKESKASVVKDTTVTKAIDEDTKSGCFPVAEPIAERLGVDYPFPPHLEYAYPPPDGNILTNIVNALIAVPRFYTQVLHLMNKMNIPAPFRMALPTPPLPPAVPTPPPPPPRVPLKPQSADLSSGESEMESSEEEVEPTTEKPKKRARRETIIGPAIDKDVAHEDVGVKPATLVPKEIPVIKKNPVLQINIAPKEIKDERKNDDRSQDLQEPEKESPDPHKFLTPEELERCLFGSIETAKSCLHVKLMQEGRMRGQAFLTFPSIELAHQGL